MHDEISNSHTLLPGRDADAHGQTSALPQDISASLRFDVEGQVQDIEETDRSAQGLGHCMAFLRDFSGRFPRYLLLMGGAGAALLAGGQSADAADRTFVWNGNENTTSFGRAGNWDQVWEPGGNPVLDSEGNPVFELIPVTDDDGNPVYEQGDQLFEHGAQIFHLPGWVSGPPDGSDTMVVTTGTPNMSGQPRSIWDLYLSGGEFIVRNSKHNVSSFSVDGTLDIRDSGALRIDEGTFGQSELTTAKVDISGGSIGGWLNPETGEFGAGRLVITESMAQSGGRVSDLAVQTPTYTQSAGTLSANVSFATLFALSGTGTVETEATLIGAEGALMAQSGGTMAGEVSGVVSYAHSGGSMGGSVDTGTYSLTDAAATSVGGTITASDMFNLAPADGTAIVAAKLSGEGNLIKSGASTVVLANTDNDFTGTVAIDAGTLEVTDDALPESAAINVAHGATLLMNTANDTVFMGAVGGQTGALVKAGTASLTLGGEVTLGGLTVDAGTIQVGTGLSQNTVSFDYAVVEQGASLHVASGATLTIRIPNNLVNHGTFINDGTVNDDLANTGPFTNNSVYNAQVLSNTGSIDNNSGGEWTGDVLSNAGRISNYSIWRGAVTGNSGSILNDGGTWEGDVRVDAGFIGNRNGASWTGAVVSNGNINNDSGSTWTGNISNGGGATNYATATWVGDVVASTAVLFNKGTWTGNVLSNESHQLSNEEGGTWNGDVRGNNNAIFNAVDSAWNGNVVANGGGSNSLAQILNRGLWTGEVNGNSASIYNDGGTWHGHVVANNGGLWNESTWTGDVLGNQGIITNRGGLWTGNVEANAGTISNRAGSNWTGDVFANSGTITTAGNWTGNFTSAGTVKAEGVIAGAVSNSGSLHITGSLGGITTLTNTGTLDLRGLGAAQTLSVNAAVFGPGATYGVDVDGHGGSDQTVVVGNANLGGTVRVAAANGAYGNVTSYTIVSAGSISGTFSGATTDLAFLTPQLSYDATSAKVIMARNDVNFGYAGSTPNQESVGAAVEAFGVGNAIHDAVLWLTPEQAQEAFDQLSGEAYASADIAAIQSAGTINGMVQSRINQAFDALGDTGDAISGYAGDTVPPGGAQGEPGLWGQVFGAGASNSEGAAPLHTRAGGLVLGADGMLGDWRLGAMLQLSATSSAVPSLNSTVSSTDYGAGIYVGKQWGATQLSLGGVYTLHDTKSARTVAFPGVSDTLAAGYLAGTAQAFAELSHEFDLGGVSLTPYAGLAHVHHATDGFTEVGGPAALNRTAQMIDATFATLGLGIDRSVVVGDDMLLTASLAAGWRHASTNDPRGVNALAGAPAFGVSGTPIASDLAVLSAGLTLDVSAATSLDLAYDAQIGSNTRAHALKATWATQF